MIDSGLQPEFADQISSDASSTRAIYHGTRPGVYSASSSSSNPSTPLPRLAALRGMSYRDQRLELGGVNTHAASVNDIAEWQNATEDGESNTSEDVWMGKEDQTSVTESTVAEEMDEQKGEGNTDDERRNEVLGGKGKKGVM